MLKPGLAPMRGRDPHERGRASTPLELLFDLTFAIAFATAAEHLAELVAHGHAAAGLTAFSFAMFATCWAWVNFSWFASAYDTDDWAFRLATMVQMVGVLILALGLPRMFASIEAGARPDNAVMVAGYVIMRVALVGQWLRAAWQDEARRRAALTYAAGIIAVQAGWVALVFLPLAVAPLAALMALFIVAEMVTPWIAEARGGGTPWHAHHIAERYSLLAIIALGEGLAGAVAAIAAVVARQGWSADAVLVSIAGAGLTFGLWWVYFMVPSAPVLHAHRGKAFGWGYGHMVIFAAIAATGAGLRVTAAYVAREAAIGPVGAVLAVAIPVATYLAAIYALYAWLMRRGDALHVGLLAGTAGLLAAAVALAAAGVGLPACLLVLTAAPLVTVVGYELAGRQRQARALAEVVGE
ncbi:low temperature requirement protein A [Caulobacter sp. KR2-114]|uniref:low temperature requirement protein A n=1 Tax=Caulobacter sp. KR2-114 TaxID=3400912 RepID=UPI003C024D7B